MTQTRTAAAAAGKPALPIIEIPAEATDSATIEIADINCWIEGKRFRLVGMANHTGGRWQIPYLQVSFFDANGALIKIDGKDEAVIMVESEYIPARGRSAFSWYWELDRFSQQPYRCEVKSTRAIREIPGTVVIGAMPQATQVFRQPLKEGEIRREDGYQVNATIENPQDFIGHAPHAQFLLYGKDKKLWMVETHAVDGTDSLVMVANREVLRPQEKRYVAIFAKSDLLPTPLQNGGVERALVLPFLVKPQSNRVGKNRWAKD